jgi:hypothetical protein
MGLSTQPKSTQVADTTHQDAPSDSEGLLESADRIVIGNLDSKGLPESPELWSFNPIKLV